MAKRLQVILQDPEYREIQRAARHMSIADCVRQALGLARWREPLGDVEKSWRQPEPQLPITWDLGKKRT